MAGRVDVPTLPSFYHDKIEFNGRIYLPFPPMASVVLIPFVKFFENTTQQNVSIIFGALDVMLIFILLKKFTKPISAILLAIFFGFGTPFFWSAIVGTTWFFAHTVGIFFIIISLILHFEKKDFLAGLFLAFAGLSRLPLILGGLFYLLNLFSHKKRLLVTILGGLIFIPVLVLYNYVRFETFLDTGYLQVYNQYVSNNYPYYTILQKINPSFNHFGYMDIRNIPLHLFTLFFFPPTVEVLDGIIKTIRPSPFGMGILFTSPLLFLVLKANLKNSLERNLLIAAVFSSIPTMLHYAQGWVQFGYRFILDYLVFLMVLLAIKFKPNKLNLILMSISLIVNFWGVSWAIRLGW